MDTAIVTVNFNSSTDTLELIDSLVNSGYYNNRTFVVDNGSSAESKAELKTGINRLLTKNITLIDLDTNHGFSGGYNRGILAALGEGFEYVLIINNDCICTPGFLECMKEEFSKSHNVGIVGAKIFFESDRKTLWTAGGNLSRIRCGSTYYGKGQEDNGQYDNHRITHVSGCCALISKQTVTRMDYSTRDSFLGVRNGTIAGEYGAGP